MILAQCMCLLLSLGGTDTMVGSLIQEEVSISLSAVAITVLIMEHTGVGIMVAIMPTIGIIPGTHIILITVIVGAVMYTQHIILGGINQSIRGITAGQLEQTKLELGDHQEEI